jgi:hypothetical protein
LIFQHLMLLLLLPLMLLVLVLLWAVASEPQQPLRGREESATVAAPLPTRQLRLAAMACRAAATTVVISNATVV